MTRYEPEARVALFKKAWQDIRTALTQLEGAAVLEWRPRGGLELLYPPGTLGHRKNWRSFDSQKELERHQEKVAAGYRPVVDKLPELGQRWMDLVMGADEEDSFDPDQAELYGIGDPGARLATVALCSESDDDPPLAMGDIWTTTCHYPLNLLRFAKTNWEDLTPPGRLRLVEVLSGCLAANTMAEYFVGRDQKSLDGELPLEVSYCLQNTPISMPYLICKTSTVEEMAATIELVVERYAPFFNRECGKFRKATVNTVSRQFRARKKEIVDEDAADVVEDTIHAASGEPSPIIVFETKEELAAYLPHFTSKEIRVLELDALEYSNEQIAVMLGIPKREVKRSLENARTRAARVRDGKPMRQRKARD